VKVLLIILAIILSLTTFGQEYSNENNGKRDLKESYFGVHTDFVYSRLEGTEGNERSLFLDDYIQDLNFNGIAAKGGITGRYASSFGAFYDRFVGQRFALHFQASYLQTGYNEKLTAKGTTIDGSLDEILDFKARLDYINLLGGVKYFNDFGITLTLGVFVNYNIIDKIDNKVFRLASGRYGSSEVKKEEELYFHEYYGVNRVVFLTGGAFAIGYKWKTFEVDFSFKITSQILSERDDMFLHLLQVGFKYQITRPK
jgi:hypothetical protein